MPERHSKRQRTRAERIKEAADIEAAAPDGPNYTGGNVELTSMDRSSLKKSPYDWSVNEFPLVWPSPKTKPNAVVMFFKQVCAVCCGGGHDDLYVRLELLETRSRAKTDVVYGAGTEFLTVEKATGKFNLQDKNLGECTLRVAIYDDDLGADRLIGYGSAPLTRLAEVNGQKLFLEVSTKEDATEAGDVYLELSHDAKSNLLLYMVIGCQQVNNQSPEVECGYTQWLIGFLVISYILIYTYCMYVVEKSHAVAGGDCSGFDQFDQVLWFVLVTFASVGYGDMYPCTDQGRRVNGIFIILNQLTLAWFFSIAVQLMIMQNQFVKGTLKALKRKCCRGDGKAAHSEGSVILARDSHGDYRTAKVVGVDVEWDELEKDWDTTYTLKWTGQLDGKETFTRLQEEVRENQPLTFKRLNWELIGTMGTQGFTVFLFVMFGTVFFFYAEKDEPGWKDPNENYLGYETTLTMSNTFHFSVVTMSTVGYGDWAPTSRVGQSVGSFFILLGVSLLANFAGIVVEHFIKREELIHSHEFLNNSLVTPKQLLEFDINGDDEVDKFEYLVQSLLACRFVSEDKIDLIMAKFHDLDTDKSGIISVQDFKDYEASLARRAEGAEGNRVHE